MNSSMFQSPGSPAKPATVDLYVAILFNPKILGCVPLCVCFYRLVKIDLFLK